MTAHTWNDPVSESQEISDEKMEKRFPGQFTATRTIWKKSCTNCGVVATSYNSETYFCPFSDCESYEAFKTPQL